MSNLAEFLFYKLNDRNFNFEGVSRFLKLIILKNERCYFCFNEISVIL